MVIKLENLLTGYQLDVVNDLIGCGRFESGKISAGKIAESAKYNLELVMEEESRRELDNLVMGALIQHPVYLNAGLPRKVAAPIYAMYQEGMFYDYHVDDPVMGLNDYRADIAITIFLNAPECYDGGVLEIETTFGTHRYRGEAGTGIMYPASSRHRVTNITRGQRTVVITWMQSLVADAGKRELLYQLYLALESLRQESPDSDTTQRVHHSYINLVRMWSVV